MGMLHQIWVGGEMPGRNRAWCESMRRWAELRGMGYRLASWEEVAARYASNPVVPIFAKALRVLPVATTYTLISDWYRLRVLADNGGWYADTDFEAVGLPAWETSADVAFFNELLRGVDHPATGMMVCRGQRGREAMRRVAEAAQERICRILEDTAAADWVAHYINAVRTDLPGRRCSLVGFIGPGWLRDVCLPMLHAEGYMWEAIPVGVACNRSRAAMAPGGGSRLWHHGTGTWFCRGVDFDAAIERAHGAQRAEAAQKAEVGERKALLAGLPAWRRPQGTVVVPETGVGAVQRCRTGRGRSCAAGDDDGGVQPGGAGGLQALLSVPRGTRRIVVFSNVTQEWPHFPLRAGDWCIHLNRAMHLLEAVQVAGTTHALIIRHGKVPGTGRRRWYIPQVADFEGIGQAFFVNDNTPLRTLPWWRTYRRDNPGKHATTGFIAANYMRTLAPGIPLYLVGFDPAGSHGTPKWTGHAWSYEAQWYRTHNFNLITPSTASASMPAHSTPSAPTSPANLTSPLGT